MSGSNELFFADITYVPMDIGGVACTAFVIDAYAGTIVGWDARPAQQLAGWLTDAWTRLLLVRLGRLVSSVQYPLVEGAGDGPLRGRCRSGPVGRCCSVGDQSGNNR